MKRKPPDRMGFAVAHHPTGAFVLRVVGSTSQTFATAKDAADWLRECASWVQRKSGDLPGAPSNFWTRLRAVFRR